MLGGRVQNDWVFQTGEDDLVDRVGILEDGTEFRRMRFYFAGTVMRTTEFKAQLDFAGGVARVMDLYLGIRRIPLLGTIRVGHQYEPMGLNELTSSKYLTFVEPATPMAFVGSRKTGLKVTNHAGPLMWAGMLSRNSDSFGKSTKSGEYNLTGRLTFLPWTENDGRKLLHLGISGSRRSPADSAKYSAHPENHLAPPYVTVAVASEATTVFGAEGALVLGPFSVQAEYLATAVDAMDASDPMFAGWYAFASFFLTGEYRPFGQSDGTFQRVRPRSNFDGEGGVGAWELAARVSRIGLDDAPATGGTLDDFTVAVNWYLNPNFRVMTNYVRADLDEAGVSHSLLTRFHVDF